MRLFPVLVGALLSTFVSADVVPSLAEIKIALHPEQSLPLSREVTFELEVSNVKSARESLQSWQGIVASQVDANTLRVTMKTKPRFSGDVMERYTQSSFVIDYTEPSTQSFIAGFNNKAPVEPLELTKYVVDYIDKPTYIHGFNIASVVASQRSGDCTEYAVLSAALARAMNIPARVILGSVIVETEKEIQAFGHAWTEVWYEDQWQILDAALYELDAKQTFYLPAGVLEKEGPGFPMAVIKVNMRMPSKIKGLRDA